MNNPHTNTEYYFMRFFLFCAKPWNVQIVLNDKVIIFAGHFVFQNAIWIKCKFSTLQYHSCPMTWAGPAKSILNNENAVPLP